jgi:hypothetical protein
MASSRAAAGTPLATPTKLTDRCLVCHDSAKRRPPKPENRDTRSVNEKRKLHDTRKTKGHREAMASNV